MRILVNSREMKQCDGTTIGHFGVPSLVLMERAALSVVDEILQENRKRERCLVVCGLGNNGGDGLAVARLLHQKGSRVTVLCDMKQEKATPETLKQYEILCRYGVPVVNTLPEGDFDLIIDAIFGIGLSRAVEGHWRETIETLNEMEGFKIAVDIPSGICADTGQVLGCAFRADLTVTFAYEKAGLLLSPGALFSGRVAVADIGIDGQSWQEAGPTAFAYEKPDIDRLPGRQQFSNKGSYGKVLVIAGKKNMAGAAYFSAKAAAVTGCGLVKILTVEENRTILQGLIPEAILEIWEEQTEEKFLETVRWADVVVAGPGLGTDTAVGMMLKTLFEKTHKPLILDADALNTIAKEPKLSEGRQADSDDKQAGCGEDVSLKGPVIVTPHLGEMARLTGKTVAELKENLPGEAVAFARDHHVICVLKDARTVTALPDGTYYINTSGNNGMSTAGAGDVLTGVIASLIAQGMTPGEAAPFGVFLHGLAGDAAALEKGCYGMLASDILEGIRQVTKTGKPCCRAGQEQQQF